MGLQFHPWQATTSPGFFRGSDDTHATLRLLQGAAELNYPRSSIEGAIRDAATWFRANGYLGPVKK